MLRLFTIKVEVAVDEEADTDNTLTALIIAMDKAKDEISKVSRSCQFWVQEA